MGFNQKAAYRASSVITCTLAGLASDANLLAGRGSAAYDNSTNLDLDVLFTGKITTGTTPTAGKIEAWLIPMLDDTNWPDGFTGTDSNITVTSRDVLFNFGILLQSMVTSTTSNFAYNFIRGARQACSTIVIPKKVQLFVVHNTVSALNATPANQVLSANGLYMTSS